MNFLFAENIFGEQLLRAISWTLVHSVWQGMAAAILAMLVLTTTKKASASLRYNFLLTILVLFCGAVAITFYLQPAIAEKNNVLTGQIITGFTTGQYQPVAGVANGETALVSIFNFLNANSQIIVLAWLLLTAIRLTQLLVGYYGINKIKKTQITSAGDYWDARIAKLAQSIMISKPVKLLQSALITTPTVISYFKPVILIPAGLLTSLPADQIEAILLHELSHIRRKDFLVNLLQNFIETIFFFNPFVFWISNLIREERENCCDDVAVLHLDNKTTLVKAMISCMEFKSKDSSVYGLAFGGRQKPLLDRAKRIINKTSRPFRVAEKMILGICIPLAAIMVIFLLQAFQSNGNEKPITSSIDTNLQKNRSADLEDETSGWITYVKGVPHYHYVFKRQTGTYGVEKVKGQIISLKIDGKTITKDKIQSHAETVNSLIAEYDNIMKQPFASLSPLSGTLAEPAEMTEQGGLTEPGAVKSSNRGLAPLSGINGLNDKLSGLKDSLGGITGVNGLASGSRGTSYYRNGYKVVVKDSVVREVYYKGARLSEEKVKEQKSQIDAVLKGRE
jgi:beta-lactamase regulating signal transducer with metallopeptidase domain